MAKPRLGSGARFKAVERSAAGARDPGAVAYTVGVRKHGKKKMAALAAAGRRKKTVTARVRKVPRK